MKKLELVLSALCLVLSALCLVLVPGFYYTLRGSGGLEGLEGVEGVDVYGPVLCEPDKPVTFEAVE